MGTKTLNINAAKSTMRSSMAAILKSMTPEDRTQQSTLVQQMVLSSKEWSSAKRVAFYLSMPDELQTEPLLVEAMKQGKTCFAPVCRKGDMKMLGLRGLEDLAKLSANNWGIREPLPAEGRDDAMESGGVDLVLVPGVAFTSAGARLGHGRGYYDRFLRAHRQLRAAPCLALAFRQQLLQHVPEGAHDERVDLVLVAGP